MTPVEAYERVHEGSSSVAIRGVCRGRCENPSELPITIHDENKQEEVLEVSWRKLVDLADPALLQEELASAISSLVFFKSDHWEQGA